MRLTRLAWFIMMSVSPMMIAQSTTGSSTSTSMAAGTPTTCVSGEFTSTGSEYYKTVNLKITNRCTQAIDFQNASLTFISSSSLNTNVWGSFAPLSYPEGNLNVSSQKQADGNYLATLNLHFATQYSTTVLPVGASFTVTYGTNSDGHIDGTLNAYLQSTSGGDTGTLSIINQSSQPADTQQAYATVHLKFNGQALNDIEIPWSSTQTIAGLALGSYTLTPVNINDAYDNNYQGTISPNSFTLTKNQTITAHLTYTQTKPSGSIQIGMSPVPDSISGYAIDQTVSVSQIPNGSATAQSIGWDKVSTISELVNGATYGFSLPVIGFNGYQCSASFNPQTLVASSTPPMTKVSYECVAVRQDSVTISVQGAPADLSTLNVTLKPNDNSSSITQPISLNEGSGSAIFTLVDGGIYTIQTEAVSGYVPSFSAQPLTAVPDAQVAISLAKSSTTSGRIIGYITGWKATPPAQAFADAGYTHAIVAFGVFSTQTPGAIVSAFSTVTADYIAALHAANVKVLLSLGGASSSIPNTTVDFHAVLTAAPSADQFKTNFINSLQKFITQYGFDGFDIDIEHGLNAQGTFENPQGDIAALADIINTMHTQNPELLISLAPQVANISATSGFDQTWGNYASLIMQTYSSLSWVGIQLYNTGCAYGLNKVCYSQTETNSPDFSVAMAADLLENWPKTIPSGQNSGFQPYISHLQPSQVVLGYPAPNAAGHSDGQAVIPTSTIIRALACLATASVSETACDSYTSPKAYGAIGGVFEWEATYDQDNHFSFATALKPCVIDGQCQ